MKKFEFLFCRAFVNGPYLKNEVFPKQRALHNNYGFLTVATGKGHSLHISILL